MHDSDSGAESNLAQPHLTACCWGQPSYFAVLLLSSQIFNSGRSTESKRRTLLQVYPKGIPEDRLTGLGFLARQYSASEIARWNVTSSDTLAALLSPQNGAWGMTQLKQLVARYLERGGALTGTLLDILGGKYLCFLDEDQLNQIGLESIRNKLKISKTRSFLPTDRLAAQKDASPEEREWGGEPGDGLTPSSHRSLNGCISTGCWFWFSPECLGAVLAIRGWGPRRIGRAGDAPTTAASATHINQSCCTSLLISGSPSLIWSFPSSLAFSFP
ncbi:Mesothelin-like protein [Varanus komodoensis]|nr:Mesothelin-like protein [Varanus komodoensis]